MPDTNEFIIHATEKTFKDEVLNAPKDIVFLVDFWAGWCAPCQMLAPILERVVQSYNGRVILAKVDLDENPALGEAYGVEGIPDVKIIKGGELQEGFVGVLPEEHIHQLLSEFVTTETDEFIEAGLNALEDGDLESAEEHFQRALEHQPDHARALLELGKLALFQHRLDEVEQYIRRVPAGDYFDEAQSQLALLEFTREAEGYPSLHELESKCSNQPDDLELHYQKAIVLAADHEYERALEELLSILKRDKKYQDGGIQKTMVKIFGILGQRHSISDRFRRELERLLY